LTNGYQHTTNGSLSKLLANLHGIFYIACMAGPGVPELTDRARDVFRTIVERYIESGEPIGSRTIAKVSGLNLSPASIRNVMQDLEELQLLAAPHTSAGRLPTETGLRLFVDGMMQAGTLTRSEQQKNAAQIGEDGPVEEAVAQTTLALSGLSACAGIVHVSKRETVLSQFGFVPLSDQQALAVLVGDDGSVENRVVDLPVPVPASTLAEVANYVSERLSGLTLEQAMRRLEGEILQGKAALDDAAQDLIARGLAKWSRDSAERPVLIVRGQANLVDETATEDLERVRLLLDELEGKEEIARLLDHARDASATKIFIGSENKLFSLSGSSVIAAPYHDGDGQVVGVVGVIGPTRLNYARVVPMVDFTAKTLSKLMS
jgi:heat-inducible transcriptional repressor